MKIVYDGPEPPVRISGSDTLYTLDEDYVVSSSGHDLPKRKQIEILGLKPGDICHWAFGCVKLSVYKVRITDDYDIEVLEKLK